MKEKSARGPVGGLGVQVKHQIFIGHMCAGIVMGT